MEQLQIISILFSLMLLVYILRIIRNQRLKEEYSLLWLAISIVFLVFSAWRQGLEKLADLLGIAYPPAALFMIMLVGILLILIQFSMIISRLSERSKVIAQDYAILTNEVEGLKKEVSRLTGDCRDQDTPPPAAQADTSPQP